MRWDSIWNGIKYNKLEMRWDSIDMKWTEMEQTGNDMGLDMEWNGMDNICK